ncbi:hypothetical protein BHU72_14535 [Desulfuribacillus stibiiarsenatis]|uniref:DUF4935 domain-containing protein n=1 Tax=Desulfuribacillus stibiiarsenatis TaxID=1390249 RepID=A0A1E5L7C9_9FIRM|nr:PIN domain-containing protein [Desulfuribacillus stibiiarsenatis]OEH86045.1 hypothetical protein BHU72_14535 [Desulfuribacillus stibiiarsenatis]
MYIFLDTNTIYKDPFFTKGKNKLLMKLAKLDDVYIVINPTVYEELLRAHLEFLKKQLADIQSAYIKLRPYLEGNDHIFQMNTNLDDLIKEFHDKFYQYQKNDQLIIVDYEADILKHIVEIDMYEKAPFIKQCHVKTKDNDAFNYPKKEIRDAIIWYSYRLFIEKNSIDDCHFISNDIKAYCDVITKATPDGQYQIHHDIKGNVDIKAYKSIEDFLTINDNKVKELHSHILSQDLYNKFLSDMKNGMAEEIILKYFSDQILSEVDDYISNLSPENIRSNYFIDGYIQTYFDGDIVNVSLEDIEILGDDIMVTASVIVEKNVEIYAYNPVYDTRDEKFTSVGEDEIEITLLVKFLLDIDTTKDIDEANFSILEYIEGNDPWSVDIEVNKLKNLNYVIPQYEEDYEYKL